jgi:hypothetical protein
MNPSCKKQRSFLKRVPYNCTDCPWAGRYPHLNASFLEDEPWKPKYVPAPSEEYHVYVSSESFTLPLYLDRFGSIYDALGRSSSDCRYWRLENNTYCDISYDGFDNRPLIDGNFDRASFGTERDNINSTACLDTSTR